MPTITKEKTFELNKTTTLPINQHVDTEFVPDDDLPYLDTNNVLTTIAYGINENLPILMIGETGTGKTSAIRYLARMTNNNLRRINLNGSTTVEEFVGKILINKDGTYWTDGILTEAMRKGYWLLIDEINAALPEILFVLQSLLDDDNYITLSEKEGGEKVKPHPDFRVFATMNPFEDYVGTKELNKALLSRFPITIKVNYPTQPQENEIIRKRFPDATGLPDEVLSEMVNFAHGARDSRDQSKLDFVFSTRDLLHWAKVYLHTQSARKAAEMTFMAKCNKDDAKALMSLLSISFVDTNMKITDMRRGNAFKLKENIVVPNVGKVIPVGTILSLQGWQSVDVNASTAPALRKLANGAQVKVERMPNMKELTSISAKFSSSEIQSRLVSNGTTWNLSADDLEGKFVPVKL